MPKRGRGSDHPGKALDSGGKGSKKLRANSGHQVGKKAEIQDHTAVPRLFSCQSPMWEGL